MNTQLLGRTRCNCQGEERKEGHEKEQGLAAINAVECFSADSVRGLPYATSDHAEPGDGQQQFEPPWGVERNDALNDAKKKLFFYSRSTSNVEFLTYMLNRLSLEIFTPDNHFTQI